MNWPGMGDPYKRKKTIKFLILTAIIGISVAAASVGVQTILNADNPLRDLCVNNRDTHYKIKATLEIIIDGEKALIPANIGFSEDMNCHKSYHHQLMCTSIYDNSYLHSFLQILDLVPFHHL